MKGFSVKRKMWLANLVLGKVIPTGFFLVQYKWKKIPSFKKKENAFSQNDIRQISFTLKLFY